MKIGTLDIRKAYKGSLELTSSNARIGTVPIVPEPQPTLDYFYLENASVDPQSTLVLTPSDCFAYTGAGSAAENFEYSTNARNWHNFSELAHEGQATYIFNNTRLDNFFGTVNNVYVVLVSKANYQTVIDAGYKFYNTNIGTDTTVRELSLMGEDANNYYLACDTTTNLWSGGRISVGVGFGPSADNLVITKVSYVRYQMEEYLFSRISSLAVGDTPSMSFSSTYADMYTVVSGSWTYYGWSYDNITANKIFLRGIDDAINRNGKSSSPFNITGIFNVGGDIRSLVDYENMEEDTLSIKLNYLFRGLTNIINAENLSLPYDTITWSANEYAGYYHMFNNCTNLISTPILPATALHQGCYCSMFEGCTSLTTAPELPATTLANNCYARMFYGCSSLTSAVELPASILAGGCYGNMFNGCTGLTTAPSILPATTLESYCYSNMFQGCSSLTNAPELPATTLAGNCYVSMFYGCSNLTTAPSILPATTLASSCYSSMFCGCSSLTSVPELPATTLDTYCYYYMFKSCTNINHITCLATDISASNCTTNWVNGVAATGTFAKNISMSGWPTGASGIPSGWTVQNIITINYSTAHATAPASKTVISPHTLTSADLPTLSDETGIYRFDGWNKNVGDVITSNTTITAQWTKVAFTITYSSPYGIVPQQKTVQTPYILTNNDLPELSESGHTFLNWSKSIGDVITANCRIVGFWDINYLKMISNGNSGISLDNYNNTVNVEYRLNGDANWITWDFTNIPLTNGDTVELRGNNQSGFTKGYQNYSKFSMSGSISVKGNIMTLIDGTGDTLSIPCNTCFYWLFKECGITTAPELPATSLTQNCYSFMFQGCSILATAPELPATNLSWYCYERMFKDCTSLTTAPELTATTLNVGSYSWMFYGCTNLNSITCLATNISQSSCVSNWVYGVAATGTFIKSHSMSNWSIGVGGIPTNWTVMDDEATISYSTDHGTVPASKTVIPPYTLTSEDLPTLTETGWIFNGWNKSVGDTILVGTTITASWTQEVQPNYLTFTK